MTIEEVKQYLSSLVIVLRGMNDPTGMNGKTCECISLLLEHCQEIEIDNKLYRDRIDREIETNIKKINDADKRIQEANSKQ